MLALKRYQSHNNYSQETPRKVRGLHLAAYFGITELFKLILQEQADVDMKDNYGQTLLSWAAKKGHEGVVKLLLEANVDVESEDRYDRTPLSWAAKNGHEGVAKLLLERVMRIEEVEFDMSITTCSLRFYITLFQKLYFVWGFISYKLI